MTESTQPTMAIVESEIHNLDMIDLRIFPTKPHHIAVLRHDHLIAGGIWQWDVTKLKFLPAVSVIGQTLEAFAEEPLANANLAQFMLVHQEYVPQELEKFVLYFGATQFLDKTRKTLVQKLWYQREPSSPSKLAQSSPDSLPTFVPGWVSGYQDIDSTFHPEARLVSFR